MTMPLTRFTHRRNSPEAAPLAADARPRLASGVVFEGAPDEAVRITMLHGVPTSRVSRTVAELLTAMNGETALHDLHQRFAASESLESFLQLVQRFRANGLLDGDTKLPPGRITYRPRSPCSSRRFVRRASSTASTDRWCRSPAGRL